MLLGSFLLSDIDFLSADTNVFRQREREGKFEDTATRRNQSSCTEIILRGRDASRRQGLSRQKLGHRIPTAQSSQPLSSILLAVSVLTVHASTCSPSLLHTLPCSSSPAQIHFRQDILGNRQTWLSSHIHMAAMLGPSPPALRRPPRIRRPRQEELHSKWKNPPSSGLRRTTLNPVGADHAPLLSAPVLDVGLPGACESWNESHVSREPHLQPLGGTLSPGCG